MEYMELDRPDDVIYALIDLSKLIKQYQQNLPMWGNKAAGMQH